jgi:hypothetical protein
MKAMRRRRADRFVDVRACPICGRLYAVEPWSRRVYDSKLCKQMAEKLAREGA